MADRKAVIEQLESVRDYHRSVGNNITADIASDALELLKEQEPVEPEVEVLNEIDRIYRCPKCHKCLFYEKQKFCDQCGRAVKWE